MTFQGPRGVSRTTGAAFEAQQNDVVPADVVVVERIRWDLLRRRGGYGKGEQSDPEAGGNTTEREMEHGKPGPEDRGRTGCANKRH